MHPGDRDELNNFKNIHFYFTQDTNQKDLPAAEEIYELWLSLMA